nr:hypothetical protein [Sicyoidochytrium minutum DNA virus]
MASSKDKKPNKKKLLKEGKSKSKDKTVKEKKPDKEQKQPNQKGSIQRVKGPDGKYQTVVTRPAQGAPLPQNDPSGKFLYQTRLGREAGVFQVGNKPWMNVVLNIIFSIFLILGTWPIGLIAAATDAPPVYTGGTWVSENIESVNKTIFMIFGVFLTILSIVLFIWWNLYYRKKRLYFLAMTEDEREAVFVGYKRKD